MSCYVMLYLAGNGCESAGSLCSKGRIYSALQTEAPLDKVSCGWKWLRQPSQKQVSEGSLDKSHRKLGSRESSCQVVPGFLQLSLSGTQTEQKMEANLGSKPFKPFHARQVLQDGNPGDNPVILTESGMGNLAGALSFGLATASLEFTKVVKG